MKAIELSRLAGTSVHTIRYYERIGLLDARRNRSNGYHEFSSGHVALLVFIRRSRGGGLSLAEIRAFIEAATNGRCGCAQVGEIVRRVLPAVEREISELAALRKRMKTFLTNGQRRRHGTPTGVDVRRLVASLAT